MVACAYGTSQASQLHVKSPNIGSQTLRLQGVAAPLTFPTTYTYIQMLLIREIVSYLILLPCFFTVAIYLAIMHVTELAPNS